MKPHSTTHLAPTAPAVPEQITIRRIERPKPPTPVVDNDLRKGAKEDDRPGPARSSHPGLDKNGMPNDPVAIAQDVVGANADKTSG